MKRLTFIPFVLIILALFIAVPTQAQILSDIDGMLTKVNFIAPQQFHSTTSYSDTIMVRVGVGLRRGSMGCPARMRNSHYTAQRPAMH